MRDAEYLAGGNISDHDLFTRRRDLQCLHMAVQQKEERLGFCALLKYMRVPGKAHRTGRAQNVLDLVACETPKKRLVSDERGIESSHKNLCVTQWNRIASILANKVMISDGQSLVGVASPFSQAEVMAKLDGPDY